MKRARVEKLVSRMWTGATCIMVGLFLVLRGWLMTILGMNPMTARGGSADRGVALFVGVTAIIVGLVIVAVAVIAKLRDPR